MTQRQPATFLPEFHELLLLRTNRPPSVFCCFSALIRRTRTAGEIDAESSDLELATINGSAMLETPPPASPSTEVVLVYAPQSARGTGCAGRANRRTIHRGLSADRLQPAAAAAVSAATPNLRAPHLGVGARSLSATLPDVRQQQETRQQPPPPQDNANSPLSSLLGTLLRRRIAENSNDDAVEMRRASPAAQEQRRGKLAKQFSVWSTGDESDGADSGGGGNRHSSYHSVSSTEHTVDTPDGTYTRSSQIQAINANEADALVESQKCATASNCPPATVLTSPRNAANDSPVDGSDCPNDKVSSRDSDIVEMYLDSILESLSEIEDALVESADVGPATLIGADLEIDIDIEELLLRLEEPIGESTECEAPEAALQASEAELARGQQSGAPEMESAKAMAVRKADDPVYGAVRRLSETGSELANGEFHFLRTRTLPTPPKPLRPLPRPPPLKPTETDTLRFPGEKATTLATAAPAAHIIANGRLRIRKRQQSYAMGGAPQRALSDWGDGCAAVLLSSHPPQSPLLTPLAPSSSLPRQATLRNAPPLPPPRAVVFHPPSLADRADYLANYLASSGQPACRWTRLPAGAHEAKPRRSASAYRRRLAARLFGGSVGSRRQQLPELKAALRQCAAEGHLPILLLPAALKAAIDDRNNNNNTTSSSGDKFCRQFRAALTDLQQPGLSAGLVVMYPGSSALAETAAEWAAAAGAATPTLLVPAGSVMTASEVPGLECCRAMLTATRQCAALSALQRLP